MNKQIESIWTDFHKELKGFIFKKIKDDQLSNDILQDVFVKIHLNIKYLTDSSKLTSWVFQITRNTIADHFRRKRFTANIEYADHAESQPEESLYARMSDCLNKKINSLPAIYQQAILLNAFENYTQLELAKILKISYSGAKTRVQRGRNKLKEAMINCSNVKTGDDKNIIDFIEAAE